MYSIYFRAWWGFEKNKHISLINSCYMQIAPQWLDHPTTFGSWPPNHWINTPQWLDHLPTIGSSPPNDKICEPSLGGLLYPFLLFPLYILLLPQSIVLNSTYLLQVYCTTFTLRLNHFIDSLIAIAGCIRKKIKMDITRPPLNGYLSEIRFWAQEREQYVLTTGGKSYNSILSL